MFYEALIKTIQTLSAILILILISRIFKVHRAYVKYKKASNGLPILPQTYSPGGNLRQVIFEPFIVHKIEGLHRRYGKTFGWMFGSTPCASTIDLDLMKTICINEPDKHVNRINLSIPFKEIEYNCILLAEGDQWRRIRRSIAPSFT